MKTVLTILIVSAVVSGGVVSFTPEKPSIVGLMENEHYMFKNISSIRNCKVKDEGKYSTIESFTETDECVIKLRMLPHTEIYIDPETGRSYEYPAYYEN